MIHSRVHLVQRSLTDVHASMKVLDGYTSLLASLSPGRLMDEPDWLHEAHVHIAALAEAGQQWPSLKPQQVDGLLRPFIDYAACVSGVEAMRGALASQPAQWSRVLRQVLLPRLEQGLLEANACQSRVVNLLQPCAAGHQRLDEALQAGWKSLDRYRKPASELWRKMSALQDALFVQERLTHEQWITTTSLFACRVRVVYRVTGEYVRGADMAGSAQANAVPYRVFALPVLFRDAVTRDHWPDGLAQRLQGICNLQLTLGPTVQALAANQAVLARLQAAQQDFAALLKKLNLIARLWQEEHVALLRVIEALEAGVSADSHLYLASLPLTGKAWRSLATLASHLASLKVERGRTVVVDPLGLSVTPAVLPALMKEVM